MILKYQHSELKLHLPCHLYSYLPSACCHSDRLTADSRQSWNSFIFYCRLSLLGLFARFDWLSRENNYVIHKWNTVQKSRNLIGLIIRMRKVALVSCGTNTEYRHKTNLNSFYDPHCIVISSFYSETTWGCRLHNFYVVLVCNQH